MRKKPIRIRTHDCLWVLRTATVLLQLPEIQNLKFEGISFVSKTIQILELNIKGKDDEKTHP